MNACIYPCVMGFQSQSQLDVLWPGSGHGMKVRVERTCLYQRMLGMLVCAHSMKQRHRRMPILAFTNLSKRNIFLGTKITLIFWYFRLIFPVAWM
mmetsp:Transcript_66924/g.112022  ORF Transcript_66924/g.112022 Transcript_66924/m.112022 type:complete len:95 (-) Transcript_66924:61-345(-)